MYGNETTEKYVKLFLQFAYEFKRVFTNDGSLVLYLGSAYIPGSPARSIYRYELLVRLCKEVGKLISLFFRSTSFSSK